MTKEAVIQIFKAMEGKVETGRLSIHYKQTNELYASIPFNTLQCEGENLLVEYMMDGSYEGASFKIYSLDIKNVDVGHSEKNGQISEGKILFETDKFYMLMTISRE